MANPICLSPLKFYDSLAKQSHRKSYAYNHITPVITKTGWIPPFQFVMPNSDISNIVPTIANNNAYINSNGGVSSGGSAFYTNPVSLPSGCTVVAKAKGYLGNVAIIAKVITAGSSYQALVRSIDSQIREYSYTNNTGSDIQVAFSGLNSGGIEVYITDRFVSICLYEAKTDRLVSSNVLQPLLNSGFSFRTVDDYNLVIYTGYKKALNSIQEGLYYLKLISSSGGLYTYYSEVFCFTNVTKDCLELEYWNETGNFAIKNGVIAFPSDFHFKLLLKGEIGKPEYNFEEESTKRLGYVYIESQVSKKTYKFNVVVPEYICDALRIVRLCDNKIIRCKDDEYEAISFEMEADWQTQGDLASVTCEFETDNVIANIGGFVPDKLGGDYNNDYNEDFDKK